MSEASNKPKYEKILGGGSLVVAYQIANKKVLLVGGGNVAAQRIVSLKIADARVLVVSPEKGLNEEVKFRIDNGEVEWINRQFIDSDLDNIDMVLTAMDDYDESFRIGQLCRDRRIPVNVADVPPLCDFYFMSQHRDGPLQIAVSTNGKGPKMANMIRVAAAKALPENMGNATEMMGKLRAKVREWEPSMKNSGKRMTWITSICEKWGIEGIGRLNEIKTKKEEEAFFDKIRECFIIGAIPDIDSVLPIP